MTTEHGEVRLFEQRPQRSCAASCACRPASPMNFTARARSVSSGGGRATKIQLVDQLVIRRFLLQARASGRAAGFVTRLRMAWPLINAGPGACFGAQGRARTRRLPCAAVCQNMARKGLVTFPSGIRGVKPRTRRNSPHAGPCTTESSKASAAGGADAWKSHVIVAVGVVRMELR